MGLLGRLLGGGEEPGPVPEWANFFDSSQYQEFDAHLREELARRELNLEFDEDRSSARVSTGDHAGHTLGFFNLAQVCRQVPRRRWRETISQHLDRILNVGVAAESATNALVQDFERARSQLKVRLYPTEMAGTDSTVSRQIAEGIQAVLVFDFPESVVGVLRENIAGWNCTDEELFEIGLANVKAEGESKPIKLPGGDGASVFGLFDDSSLFTATRALFIQDYLSADLELGAIVAIPNRHAVLFHPIVDAKTLGALGSIIPAAIGMYQQGPGSVSPHVYWWQNGVFQRQPTVTTPEGMHFNPTEEFIFQVLNRIRSPDG